MLLGLKETYKYNYISFDFLQEPWQNHGYWNLRKKIFCEEQHIFDGNDRDTIDNRAIPIVAMDEFMALVHNVVGAVRIDEREPQVWWGSRLCVEKNYRTHSRFKTKFLFDKEVNPLFTLSVGAALIYKAVSTTNYLGCSQFFAHVQEKNVKLFERLHWKSLEKISLHGYSHHLMEADLNYYPPSELARALNKVA